MSKPSGLILTDLKAGMRIEGTITHCTQYAAFVTAEVFRKGKGGVFTEVTGLLHAKDMLGAKSKVIEEGGKKTYIFEKKNDVFLAKDKKVTVFVKEVWKNSGRFTLTVDPTVDKSKILEAKEMAKTEGQERRRERRMRRQLDLVRVGETVSGVVQDVVPEGVLITVTSLGPLNVTALLGKRDLPKQFEVPPDLKE